MIENEYLIYSNYKIKSDNSGQAIIEAAARKSLLDFCRRPFFQKRVGVTNRDEADFKARQLLAEMIPPMLEAVAWGDDNQATFDNMHREICERIIQVYSSMGTVSYGIAQRWLNLTLMNLAVIEANMKTGFWPIALVRKYFHAPVENCLLRAATRRIHNRYQHALGLNCAPLRSEDADMHATGWFSPTETLPWEDWGYPEYMAFQLAVRERLKRILRSKATETFWIGRSRRFWKHPNREKWDYRKSASTIYATLMRLRLSVQGTTSKPCKGI